MEPDAREIRLRCIEAAAKSGCGFAHGGGPAAGALAVAKEWAAWVIDPAPSAQEGAKPPL